MIISVSLTTDSIAVLDGIAESAGRSRSATLERILMNGSVKTMLRNARKNPVYAERVDDGNNEAGLSTTPACG